MRKNNLISLLVVASAFAISGCGRIYTGTYVGTGTLTVNGTAMPASQLMMTLSQTTGDNITGTVSGSFGSGTVIGQASSDGSGFNTYITLSTLGTNAAMNNYGSGYGYPGNISPYGGSYPGAYPGAYTGAYPGMTGTTLPAVCQTFSGHTIVTTGNSVSGTYQEANSACIGSLTFTGQR